MQLKRVVSLCVLLIALLGTMSAQEAKPLSAADKARVEELLKNFDPRSYSLNFQYLDASGKVETARLGKAVGLASVTQTSVERNFSRAVASTNTNNNIFRTASTNTNNNIFRVASTNTNNNVFRAASTNTNNNIFKVASTNTNNNIFVNDRQAEAAAELNTILQKSLGKMPETKPLSAADEARVEELLKSFDPRSYSLNFPYTDASGKVETARLGKAVGLASLNQTSVERNFSRAVASTNTNNNIFRTASTNTNNNIFRVASTNTNNNVFRAASTNTNNNIFKVASTNTNNNIFVNDRQAEAAKELNTILQKSIVP